MNEDAEPGDFVDILPAQEFRLQGRSRVDHYDLDKMAIKARKRPGVPLLAGRNIPYRYSNSLRVRRRDPYITEDGRIKVSIQTSKENKQDPRLRLVDVYFVWEPFTNN